MRDVSHQTVCALAEAGRLVEEHHRFVLLVGFQTPLAEDEISHRMGIEGRVVAGPALVADIFMNLVDGSDHVGSAVGVIEGEHVLQQLNRLAGVVPERDVERRVGIGAEKAGEFLPDEDIDRGRDPGRLARAHRHHRGRAARREQRQYQCDWD